MWKGGRERGREGERGREREGEGEGGKEGERDFNVYIYMCIQARVQWNL